MSITLRLAKAIYPLKCLEQASAEYSHLVTVEIQEIFSSECSITVSAKLGGEIEKRLAIGDFLNYLLDLAAENHLGIAKE